ACGPASRCGRSSSSCDLRKSSCTSRPGSSSPTPPAWAVRSPRGSSRGPSSMSAPDSSVRPSADWLEQYRENRWLNLGDVTKIVTPNPFANRTQYEIENPHVFLIDLMRKPEYFGFTVKYLFGKTLVPFQLAVLRELWTRPFPMLLGSRGAGKSWI